MQAHDMPFTKLINVDQGAREHFHVPKYQREYTWKKWQWEQLLNDIEDIPSRRAALKASAGAASRSSPITCWSIATASRLADRVAAGRRRQTLAERRHRTRGAALAGLATEDRR